MHYRFASHVDLLEKEDGGVLIRQIPLGMLRVNRPCVTLLNQIKRGEIVAETAKNRELFNQLVARGFLEQQPAATGESTPLPKVSVVIPVRNRADELDRCLSSLARLRYPPEQLEIIVVDDGSRDDTVNVAQSHGAVVIASGGDGVGPASARNCGAAVAAGEVLAFIDSDCTASPQWLQELIPLFTDNAIGAIGGMVDGMHHASMLDRYEAVMSSLSLGNHQRVAGKGEDTFYLPSCNFLVRRDLFLQLGGFRPAMQVGEDVDLSWRIRDQGWRIAYLPEGKIFHEHRNRFGSFMSRRFFYGTSEEQLQRLHPLRRKQMAVPLPLAGLLLVCLLIPGIGSSGVVLAGLMFVTDSLIIWKKTALLKIQLEVLQLMKARLRTMVSLLYYISYHLVRYYLVPVLVLSFFMPKFIPMLILLAGCAVLVDFAVRKPQISFPAFLFYYLAEHLAYGLGVFWGCLKKFNFLSYTMVVRSHLDGFV